MFPTVPSSGRPIRWGLTGLLFVLVLGVIGMHGVGPHGIRTARHGEPALVLADAAAAGKHGSHVESPASQVIRITDAVSSDDDARGLGLLDVCLAVLLGLAVFLPIALASDRGPALVLHVHRLRAGMRRRARRPDLPSLTQLSLLRC